MKLIGWQENGHIVCSTWRHTEQEKVYMQTKLQTSFCKYPSAKGIKK